MFLHQRMEVLIGLLQRASIVSLPSLEGATFLEKPVSEAQLLAQLSPLIAKKATQIPGGPRRNRDVAPSRKLRLDIISFPSIGNPPVGETCR